MHRRILVAASAAAVLAGCPPSHDFKSLAPAATAASTSFSSPLDATLSPDGRTAYFIAVLPEVSSETSETPMPERSGVFMMPVGSTEAPTLMASTDPLASPLNLDISSDGKTLYIADSTAGVDLADNGSLLKLDTAAGGTLAMVDPTLGYRSRGIIVVNQDWRDQVYFTGNDPADGLPGVFKLDTKSNEVTVVSKSELFVDPSGIVVADNGDIFVADTQTGGLLANVIHIPKGKDAVELIPNLMLGYPAGISISKDQQILLVSALDPETSKDTVIRYDLKANTMEMFNEGISGFEESAGLHRAKDVESYVWADSQANGGGTVYVINGVK
ncbi:MAG TPA: hypothetical protein VIG99_08995 [Myxococcaceae bacterium]|jgi:streptogramin lyase